MHFYRLLPTDSTSNKSNRPAATKMRKQIFLETFQRPLSTGGVQVVGRIEGDTEKVGKTEEK